MVEQEVWSRLFGRNGCLLGKTVILANNSVKRFKDASHIAYLKDGTVASEGSYESLITAQDVSFRDFCALSTNKATTAAKSKDGLEQSESKEADVLPDTDSDDLDLEAHATQGTVLSSILFYLRKSGWQRVIICSATCFLAWPLFQVGFLVYIKYWTQDESADDRPWAWIGGLCGLTVLYLLLSGTFWQQQLRYMPISAGRKTQRLQLAGCNVVFLEIERTVG